MNFPKVVSLSLINFESMVPRGEKPASPALQLLEAAITLLIPRVAPDISRNYRTSREVATKLDPLLHQNTSINTDQFLHRTEEQSYISKLNGNTYHISVWERGESSRNDIINDKSKLFYKVDCRNGPIKLISYNIGNLTQEKDGSTNYNFKADAKYSESISKKKSRIWNPP